jgi:hypothetical protein
MHCSYKPFSNMCCHYRRPREAKIFSWPSVEAALPIFNVVRFCLKSNVCGGINKNKEIPINAEP